MDKLKELVGSIINSFLGPNKSNKLVLDGKDFSITRCPLHIFQSIHIQDPLCSLIEETLFAHHELYGCSTLSLLAMWYLWHEELKRILEEGCEMQDIAMHSQDILELVISSLNGVAICVDSMLIFKKHGEKICEKVPLKALNVFGQAPISVLYSSRHFSPSQNILHSDDKSGKSTLGNSDLEESSLKTMIDSLDHDEDSNVSDLVLECWKRQMSSTKIPEFKTEGLIICPITLPCSNSTVLDGLLIKSNSNHSCYSDMENTDTFRTLVIKDSITFEHVHLGFSPKVSISVLKTSDSSLKSDKEKWREKCCKFILQLNINILLVKDDIDPEVADFCSSHSVFVLSHVPVKIFKALCHNLQYSPCSYIWDCNEECVIKNLTVKKWEAHKSLNFNSQYFLCNICSADKLPLQSIILCHPSQAVLDRTEHQIWHLTSRLSLSFQSKKLLPGGEVEKWCHDYLKKCSLFPNTSNPKTQISIALSNGFINYSKIISSKKAQSTDSSTKVLDEMSSKLSAWRSALSLSLLALQCDTAIINGFRDLPSAETKNLNVNTL